VVQVDSPERRHPLRQQGASTVSAGQQVDSQRRDAQPRRELPPEALAGLRAAFAAELAERLPRLLSISPGSDTGLLQQARRDAHNLASSAVVVGQKDAARVARQIEVCLESGSLADLEGQVTVLARLLDGWDV